VTLDTGRRGESILGRGGGGGHDVLLGLVMIGPSRKPGRL
jgi:hypothetical protein